MIGEFEFLYGGIKEFPKKDGEMAFVPFLIDMKGKSSEALFCDDETMSKFRRVKELDRVKVQIDVFTKKDGSTGKRLVALAGVAGVTVDGVRPDK